MQIVDPDLISVETNEWAKIYISTFNGAGPNDSLPVIFQWKGATEIRRSIKTLLRLIYPLNL